MYLSIRRLQMLVFWSGARQRGCCFLFKITERDLPQMVRCVETARSPALGSLALRNAHSCSLGRCPVVLRLVREQRLLSRFHLARTTMVHEIRVIIADDHPLLRRGLRSTIEGD